MSCVLIVNSSVPREDRALLVLGTSNALIACGSEKKVCSLSCNPLLFRLLYPLTFFPLFFMSSQVVSSAWHDTIGHLMAFVERVWGKPFGSFSLLDAQGLMCSPKLPTSVAIERMLKSNCVPVFIVTDSSTLLSTFGSRVVVNDGQLVWGEKVLILFLPFFFFLCGFLITSFLLFPCCENRRH